MLETVELQRQALNTPVDPRFVRKNPNVKGNYTTGDYVRWRLNQIFGPDNWSHSLIQGPDLVTLNDQHAYVQVVVRMSVQFANGQQVVHEDVGVWPMQATRGADLESTAPERYETVIKSAVTDGVKACAEHLGLCFRPMADEALDAQIRQMHGNRAAAAQPAPAPNAATAARVPVEPRQK